MEVTDTPAEIRARLSSPGGWATVGSASEHRRYAKRIEGRRGRRRCPWCPDGQTKRSTHVGMANGVALATGCEWHVAVWVRDAGR